MWNQPVITRTLDHGLASPAPGSVCCGVFVGTGLSDIVTPDAVSQNICVQGPKERLSRISLSLSTKRSYFKYMQTNL